MNLRSYPLSFVRRSVWLSAQRLGGRLSLRLAGVKLSGVLYPPSFGPADGSSPIISQGTPIRSTCALTSSGSADERSWQRCEEQASGDRQRPAVSAPLVPCRESSRWVINGFTAVEFAWRWDVDVGSPLGEFLVGHRPSRVWLFDLALIKSSPLLGWGEFEVAHLHHRA